MHCKNVAPSHLPSFLLPCPQCGSRLAITAVAPARLANGAASNNLEDVTHIRRTADAAKADKRTRSKWSRVMRYAAVYKPDSEPLDAFIKRKGGINACAARFTRCLGRGVETTSRCSRRR
jgi:hypothetical protein